MRVEFMGKPPPSRQRSQQVFAVHGCDLSMELAMLDCLKDQNGEDPPLLPHLLRRCELSDKDTLGEQYKSDADDFTHEFNLNQDQAEALRSTAAWLQDEATKVSLAYHGCLQCPLGGNAQVL